MTTLSAVEYSGLEPLTSTLPVSRSGDKGTNISLYHTMAQHKELLPVLPLFVLPLSLPYHSMARHRVVRETS